MSEQNQPLSNENSSSEVRLLTPGAKFMKRKLCQVQNKAVFFQGQLNPLISQNEKLKSQLTLLNKSVMLSTQLLRGLLPIGGDESRRLKLQLANIEQISEMIGEDWHMMEEEIERKGFAVEVLERKMGANREEYERVLQGERMEREKVVREMQGVIKEMESEKERINKQLEGVKIKWRRQIDELTSQLQQKRQQITKLNKEFLLYQKQVHTRNRQYQKTIQRMRQQMSGSLLQFQQGKRSLREIYEKLMSEKLLQQAEGFEMMLRNKDQQRERLIIEYQYKLEERDKCLNQKSLMIQKMEEKNDMLRKQIQKRDQLIEQYKEKVEILHRQVNSSFQEITSLKHKNTLHQERLKLMHQQMSQSEGYYKKELQSTKKKFASIEEELLNKNKLLEDKNNNLNQELSQKVDKLKLTQKSLANLQRKFTRQLEEQQQKWAVEKLLLEEKVQQLDKLIEEKQSVLMEKEKLHMEAIRKMQTQRHKQMELMRDNYEREISQWRQSSQSQLAMIKMEAQRLLKEERLKNKQQMERITIQFNTKMRQKEEEFTFVKNNLYNQLKSKDLLIEQTALLINNLQKQMEIIKSEHEQQLNKVKNEMQKQLGEVSRRAEEQRLKMQQEMTLRSAEYENNLKKIQQEMMNQINMLKSSSALDQMQSRYLAQMQSMKKMHQQQLTKMEEQQKSTQQSLIDQQKRQIQQLIRQYEQDMTRLAKRLQTDIQKLNDQLAIEQNEHQITKMTREDKIKYLSKKINDLKIHSEQKENKILQLMLEIQNYKKEQERIKQIIEEKVNQRRLQLEKEKAEFMAECQINVDKTKSQAQRKVNQAERDRLQHTQNMYDMFNQLKEFHQDEMSKIKKKYFELQRMFSERPSRAEDLSKIKELIQIKEKMNLEIKSYHKKVEHANQIVKYLNLELENYKDNYDMFGPGEETQTKQVQNDNGTMESSVSSIMKLRKIANQRFPTEGAQPVNSLRKYENYSPKNLRQETEPVSVKDFQLYPQRALNDSVTLLPESDMPSDSLLNGGKRSTIPVNKINRGKSLDKSGEIVLNAENFLKLIRSNSKANTPLYKDVRSNQKRAYRKSKPRRLNTLGLGSGEIFTLARKSSIYED